MEEEEEEEARISWAMAVGEDDAKGESADAVGRMSIGITEELRWCGITVTFSSWCGGIASYEKFSNGISVPDAFHPSSGYADIFLYGRKGSIDQRPMITRKGEERSYLE